MVFRLLHDPGVHETKIRAHFRSRVQYDGAPVFEHPLLLLGFTNRCGSNLLAGYLRERPGLAGFHEQLNFDFVMAHSAREGIRNFPDYIRHFASKHPRHGFKASVDQIAMLYRFGITRMYPSVRVLHIQRRDLLAQAVSYSIADQTKQWISKHRKQAEAVYDRTDIDNRILGFSNQNGAMRVAPQVFGFEYECLDYEDLSENALGTVKRACRFFGVKPPGALGAPWIERQANEVNRSFIERYRRDIHPG